MADPSASLPVLSKSRYLHGLQCPKRLFLEVHAPHLASPSDAWTQALLERGRRVGEVAWGRFPGGVLVEESALPVAIATTTTLLADPQVPAVFEGCFEHDGLLIRVDVLERAGDAWRLIEVKSATRVKDEHADDVAVQVHVLRAAGVPLAGAYVMHIDPEYLHSGTLDPNRLFRLRDVTEAVEKLQPQVPARVAAMYAVLPGPQPPSVDPTYHCHDPVSCPFWDHCRAGKPERWIFCLPGGRRIFDDLTSQGIVTIDEIPADCSLTAVQRRVKDHVQWIGPRLREALQGIRYPVCHLDFETMALAIPRYPGTRPYQAIPFQWSNHIQSEDGTVSHQEHIAIGREDPRENLALDLLESLGPEGSICVYSGYEEQILRELAVALPRLAPRLQAAIERLWDLLPVVRNNYYHPDFGGSFSIKSVVPALVPSLAYDDLAIRDGGMASVHYYRMIFEATDPAEKAKIRRHLLDYCARDTLAMVELRRALSTRAVGD